jgi:hypothetical protein
MSIVNQAPPAWLVEEENDSNNNTTREGGSGSISPRVSAVNNSSIGLVEGSQRRQLSPEEERKARIVYFGIKGITLLLCALMFTTACIRLENIAGLSSSGQAFVASYMIFFSVLLAAFEISQTKQIIWLDHMLRRNFGFLFSAMGKAFFFIFIAFLCLGLDGEMAIGTGICVAAFGIGQVTLYLKRPEYFDYIPAGYEVPLDQESLNSNNTV